MLPKKDKSEKILLDSDRTSKNKHWKNKSPANFVSIPSLRNHGPLTSSLRNHGLIA
jgi:hypothetical protein